MKDLHDDFRLCENVRCMPCDRRRDAGRDCALAPFSFRDAAAGPGRDLVEATCGSCHDIEMVAINGRSEERWGLTVDEMVGYGLRLSPTDRALILGIWRPICRPNRLAMVATPIGVATTSRVISKFESY